MTHAISSLKCWSHAQCVYIEPVQSNPVNTDTEEAILGVRIKWVEFRENVKAFFPQGQSKLCVKTIKRLSIKQGLTVQVPDRIPVQITTEEDLLPIDLSDCSQYRILP